MTTPACVSVCVWSLVRVECCHPSASSAVMRACLKPGKPASSPGTLVPHRPQGHQVWHAKWKSWRGECERHPWTVVMGCHVVAGVPLCLQRSKSNRLYSLTCHWHPPWTGWCQSLDSVRETFKWTMWCDVMNINFESPYSCLCQALMCH